MMKRNNIDWPYLRQGIFRPGVSLLVVAVILGISLWYHHAQSRFHDGFAISNDTIHDEYDALVYRRRLLERYHNRYQELRDTGFIGQEKRLDWIESIRAAARDLDLPSVAYSLEPQLEVIRPVDSSSPNTVVQIYQSRIGLELGLVHELDLLRFFRRMEDEAPGLMKVDRCVLTPQFDQSKTLGPDSNILANCSMVLFSVITSDIEFTVAEVRP